MGGPLFTERTSVGLDVHARSVVATARPVRCSGRGWLDFDDVDTFAVNS